MLLARQQMIHVPLGHTYGTGYFLVKATMDEGLTCALPSNEQRASIVDVCCSEVMATGVLG